MGHNYFEERLDEKEYDTFLKACVIFIQNKIKYDNDRVGGWKVIEPLTIKLAELLTKWTDEGKITHEEGGLALQQFLIELEYKLRKS